MRNKEPRATDRPVKPQSGEEQSSGCDSVMETRGVTDRLKRLRMQQKSLITRSELSMWHFWSTKVMIFRYPNKKLSKYEVQWVATIFGKMIPDSWKCWRGFRRFMRLRLITSIYECPNAPAAQKYLHWEPKHTYVKTEMCQRFCCALYTSPKQNTLEIK